MCSDDRMFGTPGGDINEFVMALQVYSSMTNTILQMERIVDIFDQFMDQAISYDRPFYYHTDDTRLANMFANISKTTNSPIIQVLPLSTPANETVWLNLFGLPEFQGCGHLRMSLTYPDQYGYTNDKDLLAKFLRVFLIYYWNHPDKRKIMFSVKLGSLRGRSVSIVTSEGGCTGSQPYVLANTRGATSFVYSKLTVEDFRSKVLSPFFASLQPPVDVTLFSQNLQKLGDKQLDYTLSKTGLYVANQVSVFSVTAKVSGEYTPPPAPQVPGHIAAIIGITYSVGTLLLLIVVVVAVVGVVVVLRMRDKSGTNTSKHSHLNEKLVQDDN